MAQLEENRDDMCSKRHMSILGKATQNGRRDMCPLGHMSILGKATQNRIFSSKWGKLVRMCTHVWEVIRDRIRLVGGLTRLGKWVGRIGLVRIGLGGGLEESG